MHRTHSLLFVSLLSSSTLVACGGGGDTTIMDSGPHIDLGTGTDAGGGTDMGGGTDLGGGTDMGLTGMCAQPLMPLPAMYLPRCAAATATCADGATTSAALTACFTADTTPSVSVSGQTLNCGSCVNYQEFACFDAHGCHDAVAGLNCCVAAMCPTPTTACAMAMCGTQYSALTSCATTTGAMCLRSTGQYVMDCYGTAATDGGAGDASTDLGPTSDGGPASDAGPAPDLGPGPDASASDA